MAVTLTDRFGRMGTQSARFVVAGAATVFVLAVSAVLVALGVDTVETVATLLVAPVFAVALYTGRVPGFVAAAVATGVYVVLRRPDLGSTGSVSFGLLIVTRAAAYGIVAHAGAWARTLVSNTVSGADEWADSPLILREQRRERGEPDRVDEWTSPTPVSARATERAPAAREPVPARSPALFEEPGQGEWVDQPHPSDWRVGPSALPPDDPESGPWTGPTELVPAEAPGWSPAGHGVPGGPGAPDGPWSGQVPAAGAGGPGDRWSGQVPAAGAVGPWSGEQPAAHMGGSGEPWSGRQPAAGAGGPGDRWSGQQPAAHMGGSGDRWSGQVPAAGAGGPGDRWSGQHPAAHAGGSGEPWSGRQPAADAWSEGAAAGGYGEGPRSGQHRAAGAGALGAGSLGNPWSGQVPAVARPSGRQPALPDGDPGDWQNEEPGTDRWGGGPEPAQWPQASPSGEAWADPQDGRDAWGAGTDPGYGGPDAAAAGPHGPWGEPGSQPDRDPDHWSGAVSGQWPGAPATGEYDPDEWSGAPPAGGGAGQPSAGQWSEASATGGYGADRWSEPAAAEYGQDQWSSAPPVSRAPGQQGPDHWSEAAPAGRPGTGQHEQWPGVAAAPGVPGQHRSGQHGQWPAAGPAAGGPGQPGAPAHSGEWAAPASPPAHLPAPASTPPPPLPVPAGVGLPPVDPETRLWSARYLCDRLATEQREAARDGRPFSLVLVQVPDGPLAALSYRRQLTLLRELGHQFVAGGLVDHLVHVPDQVQHWFAVILPDTDRAGAQGFERRLRNGIGGYLRSRGLLLGELESACLTSPDDDSALGVIWDTLIARGEPAGGNDVDYDYRAANG